MPGFPEELNGWISVDAKIRGKSLRFFGTHLEAPLSQIDTTQVLQGLELIAIMGQSKLPVIVAEDFNSDASGLGIGPDQTPTAAMIVEAGYGDTWQTLHPEELGLTLPLYLEDRERWQRGTSTDNAYASSFRTWYTSANRCSCSLLPITFIGRERDRGKDIADNRPHGESR